MTTFDDLGWVKSDIFRNTGCSCGDFISGGTSNTGSFICSCPSMLDVADQFNRYHDIVEKRIRTGNIHSNVPVPLKSSELSGLSDFILKNDMKINPIVLFAYNIKKIGNSYYQLEYMKLNLESVKNKKQ